MFVLKLNKIRLLKNDGEKPWLGIFDNPGEYGVFSIVTTEQSPLPDFRPLLDSATTKEEKGALVASLVLRVADFQQFVPIKQISNNREFTFGDAGRAVFYTEQGIPDLLNWTLMMVEFDADVRKVGATLSEISGDQDFSDLVAKVSQLAVAGGVSAANPVAGITAMAAAFFFKVIGKKLEKNGDDQVGFYVSSYVRQTDYPHGMRKRDKSPDLTGNMLVDYEMFGTDISPLSDGP